MANVANIKEKLLETIRNNIPLALVLSGEWGVGKTRLWEEFYEDNKNNFINQKKKNFENIEEDFIAKKYAYISLFGLDSLDSLKLAIAMEVQTSAIDNSALNVDVSKYAKKFLGFIGGGSTSGSNGDMRFGMNISNKLVTNIIMSHLKNTLVCLDDIERKSDSLPMSEVMGLVNYLKNERKCQVVVILHDEESEDRNYFDKHKEKVFDEVLILNESLNIIQKLIDDEQLFPIYKKFYQELQVKNIRFYKRVQKMFLIITTRPEHNLSFATKEKVLESLLVIMLAHDMPYFLDKNGYTSFDIFVEIFDENNIIHSDEFAVAEMSHEDLSDSIDQLSLNQARKSQSIKETLKPFYNNFIISERERIITSLLRDLEFNSELTAKVAKKDDIENNNSKINTLHKQLMDDYHDFRINPKFPEELYYMACSRFEVEDLNNLSFYCDVLKASNKSDLSDRLESHIKLFIQGKISASKSQLSIDDWYSFGKEPYDRFYDFTAEAINNHRTNNVSFDTIAEIFLRHYERGGWNDDDKTTLLSIDKSILEKVIWLNIDNNHRYRKPFIKSIISHPLLAERKDEIRQLVVEILQESIEESSSHLVAPIKIWLNDTDNLRNL
ncbi:P-loop NTPase fold protein [Psychrobacter alimentarius]|uniref:P-loop NTPase fold protein n=1 Tax=Psychrobacter alimentarius TaxID=261164 RepID=UPI001918725F|nr:P-loop NTPase fold protein [Psychrobacter alimentarius]